MKLTAEKARFYQEGVADVICWLKGYVAAQPVAEMPPGWRRLMELNGDLCDFIAEQKDANK